MVIIMKKKWIIDSTEVPLLDNQLNPLIQRIIYNRGITEKSELNRFLDSKLNDLYDPFLMKDMEKAAERIISAVSDKEKIIIYGDYDVDGITSTTLLYRFLKNRLNYEVAFYLPNRLKEGYGINQDALANIIKNDYRLLISVDCGITAINEVEFAVNNGLEVIITDHHQPGDELPPALAVIDPHRSDDKYPFKFLAGVGVAFKLCQAIEKKLSGQLMSIELENLLEIVTLGTVADIVTIRGENRIIVKNGLVKMSDTIYPGIKALIKATGLKDRQITTGHIGFILAPPLNAAGRMDDPQNGIKLLITEDIKEADELANMLVVTNKERQTLEEEIYKEAVKKVENEIDLEEDKGIVLASEDWHHGVIGIVASRLVERYYRPVIMIALEDGIGKGSCRSINGLNIYQALQHCSDQLAGFGGHSMAAGLEILAKNLDFFRRAFNDYLNKILHPEDLIPALNIDAVLTGEEIDFNFIENLVSLEPYGVGNPKPRFVLSNVTLNNSFCVGKEKKHLKFTLQNGFSGIGFGFGENKTLLDSKRLDLAFFPEINEWNGKKEIQIIMEDFNLREEIEYYPLIYSNQSNISYKDKRECPNWLGYIDEIADRGNKIVLFIREISEVFKLKKQLKTKYFFDYNPKNLKQFNNTKEGILVLTKLPINRDTIITDDLIFLNLPFSIGEMNKIINLCRFKSLTVHFLYGQKQLELNQHIIKKRLPGEEYLRRFYLYLMAFKVKEIELEEIKQGIIGSEKTGRDYLLDRSLTIFEELGLLSKKDRVVRILPPPEEKLDLSDSISYNENVDIINGFNNLTRLAYAADLSELILLINS